MDKIVIHTYKTLKQSYINVKSNGDCNDFRCWIDKRRDVKNKMACYYTYSDNNLLRDFADTMFDSATNGNETLFVSPECKTARDTFRNSGYTITLDKNKADVIVVPDIKSSFSTYNCNMVAYNAADDTLLLVSINKWGNLQLEDKDMLSVRQYLELNGWNVDDTPKKDIMVSFIPKCSEWEDILTNNMLNVPYIEESHVKINSSTKISPETLVFWENINDANLFVRTICTSDWSEYPCTLLVLLVMKKVPKREDQGVSSWCSYSTGDFSRILSKIGYESYYSNNNYYMYNFDILEDKIISKKDYDMLQAYTYYKLGIDANGGLVSPKKWNKLPLCVRNLMQKRIALKPTSIPVDMKVRQIKDLFND